MKFANDALFSGSNAAANATSEVVDVRNIILFCLHIVWTAGATASVQVQKSADRLTWVNEGAAVVMAAGPSSSMFEKVDAAYPYMRVVVTGAGAGTYSIYYFGKGV